MNFKSKGFNLWFKVEELFKGYPFQLVKDGISILEGDDEGLFSWFTVNYLNGEFLALSRCFSLNLFYKFTFIYTSYIVFSKVI